MQLFYIAFKFNKFKHADAIADAEARSVMASDKKIREGIGLLDDVPTENLKNELAPFIKSLQVPVPNGDGSNTPNLLHTNAETLAKECVSLPIDPMLKKNEINYIVKIINNF